ncbi:MAG: hypothetical protein EOM40_12620 [Clostridia bacterium]|nr:hypothetical protein [Clostridia bacterium]
MTRTLVDYCVEYDIRTVIIGDITNIRKDHNQGNETNQKLHAAVGKVIRGVRI